MIPEHLWTAEQKKSESGFLYTLETSATYEKLHYEYIHWVRAITKQIMKWVSPIIPFGVFLSISTPWEAILDDVQTLRSQ